MKMQEKQRSAGEVNFDIMESRFKKKKNID